MEPVRKIRLLKEITMDDIFLQTKIPISKLSRIERGIFQPNEIEKKLISEALREPVSKIFPEK